MSVVRLPIIRHGQYTWDRKTLPEAEFERRLAAVRAAMRARGLDGLIVYSDMLHSGRAAYLINCHVFDPRMPNLVLVTHAAFDAVLKVTSRDLVFFKTFTPARLVNVDFLTGDIAARVGELAGEAGVVGKRIGLVGAADLPMDALKKLRTIFGADRLLPADDLLADLQRTKGDTERDLMTGAAATAEAVLADIVACAKPGTSERTLAARADYAARLSGCQDVEFLVHTAQGATPGARPAGFLPFRPASGAQLKDGDNLGVFLAIQVQGYWVELSQTIFVGTPRAEQIVAHGHAVARFETLLSRVRPAANVSADQWGDETTSVWLHGTGNDRDEHPRLTTGADMPVEGDLLSAHLAVESPAGTIFLGRQIAVAANGSRCLQAPVGGFEVTASGRGE